MSPSDRRRILIDYLHMKAEECDWHGVRDASNDLRELEAAHPESVVVRAVTTQVAEIGDLKIVYGHGMNGCE